MFTNFMKSAAIAILLGPVLWRPPAGYELVMQVVVCRSAMMVMRQAGFASRYFLAAASAAAVLFNPVAPVVLSSRVALGRNPGSESL
jgi:hypothetical protein